jgi:hypothetical protein
VSLRAWWREQGVALGLLESSSEIFGGGKKDVGGAGGWHRKVVGEPINGIGNLDGVGGRNPYLVASIVVEARASIVASSGVDRESFMAFSTFMCVDLDSGQGKRSFVEIERAVNLGIGG